MDARTLTGAETFLRMLTSMGIERIFASPGSEWAPVWEHLAKTYPPGTIPQYTSTRHEEVALGMASGYYKTTGKLAAVMIHTTVGSLHGAMALRGALHENVPMVVFSGESVGFAHEPGPDPGAQWQGSLADVGGPARLLAPVVKWSFGVNAASALPGTIQRACQIATAAPRGPVFISLPIEYLFDVMQVNPPASAALPIRATAAPAGIEQLADMLASAKNPVIVTERSGENHKAVPILTAIAELLGAPVAEARGTKFVNFPRTHALHAGFNVLGAIKDADVIFCLSTIAPWHPSNAAPAAGVKVAMLDENPLRTEKPVWGYHSDLCLFGEVEGSLAALLEALKKRVKSGDAARAKNAENWAAKNNARRQKVRDDAMALKDNAPLDERYVAHVINETMPSDVIYVDETITTHGNLLAAMDKVAVNGYIQGAVGGLGTGLGTALGAKAGNPKRPVVCMIGDGSFNYNPVVGALGAAQEHDLPFMIIIFNNFGYQSQQGEIPHFYPGGHTVTSGNFKASGTAIKPNPEYAALAPIYGGYGEKVEKPTEVRAALERGLKALGEGKVVLLDVRLKPVQG